MSLQSRLLVPVVVIVILTMLSLGAYAEMVTQQQIQAETALRGATVLDGIMESIEERKRSKLRLAELLADFDDLPKLLASRDVVGLAQLLVPLQVRLELGYVSIYDTRMQPVSASRSAGATDRADVLKDALTGIASSRVRVTGEGIDIFASAPIKGPNGIVGAMLVGRTLKEQDLRLVGDRAGVSLGWTLSNRLMGATLTDDRARRVLEEHATTLHDPVALSSSLAPVGLHAQARSLEGDSRLLVLTSTRTYAEISTDRTAVGLAAVIAVVTVLTLVGWLQARSIAGALTGVVSAQRALIEGHAGAPLARSGVRELDELGAITTDLTRQLAFQRQALSDANLALEKRVGEKTQELSEAVTHLEAEVAQRQRAEDDRERTLRQVQQEREKLAGLVESMSQGLLMVDASGTILTLNENTIELLGARSGQYTDAHIESLLASVADASAAKRVRELVMSWFRGAHATSAIDVWIVGSPGRDVRMELFAVRQAGGPGDALGVLLTDVTHERALQRTKDEMVAVVSHELRTPLAAVVGFAELILGRTMGEDQRQHYLGVMVEEGRRLTRLINDFLDLERLESGRQSLELRPVDLGAIVAHALNAMSVGAPHHVTLDIAAGPTLVSGNEEALQQVMSNLLSNAVKYSPGGGEIRVALQSNAERAEISVHDQGLGLPADAGDKLFDKFYRVDNTDRRAIKGTGLGLAICKRIVQEHGGEIRALSQGLGHGTTITFSLPLLTPATDPTPTHQLVA